MLSYTTQPSALSAVFNPIEVEVSKSDYVVGDLFFLELFIAPNAAFNLSSTNVSGATLITTFTKNGTGAGTCKFDLSDALSTQFTDYYVTNTVDAVQFDNTAVKAYFYKVGHITYDSNNNQVKNYFNTSGIKFALRAAYEIDGSMTASDYLPEFQSTTGATPSEILSAIPYNSERAYYEPTFIAVLVPKRDTIVRSLQLHASIRFKDGSSVDDKIVASTTDQRGGVFIFNAKPEAIDTGFKNIDYYDVWVEYIITAIEGSGGEGGEGEV